MDGTLVVINGDALLEPGAEITGNLIVVGGTVEGATEARVAGELRQYREPLLYRLRGEGDEIAYAPNLRRRALWNPGARVSWGTADTRSSLTIATGGTFIRVEGLPIVFGPLFDWKLQDNLRIRLDALGVFRSAGDLSDKRSDLGYMLRTELRSGEVEPFGVGFRAYDIVAPVEDWGLRNAEVGWSAFVFARDYRDYYLNKGWAARVFAHPERQIAVALELRRDWQASVAARDPWTLFRNSDIWRPNPPIDEGHYLTLSANGTIDTRNDPDDPTAGWLVRATLEHSSSKDVTPQTGVPAVRSAVPGRASLRTSESVGPREPAPPRWGLGGGRSVAAAAALVAGGSRPAHRVRVPPQRLQPRHRRSGVRGIARGRMRPRPGNAGRIPRAPEAQLELHPVWDRARGGRRRGRNPVAARGTRPRRVR